MEVRDTFPSIRPWVEDEGVKKLLVERSAGIAAVYLSASSGAENAPPQKVKLRTDYTRAELSIDDFDRDMPLALVELGQNGKERRLINA